MIPPHMIPTFALVGCFIIFMLTLSAVLVAVATNEDVQKALEELENEENNDPSSSPTPSPSPSQPRFRYPIGTTVKCEENDPNGENEKNRYRVSSNQGKLRHYPDDDIAKSWDEENWEYEDYIEDCDGLALGDPMTEKPPVGASVRCGKNDLKGSNNISVYRVNADATLGHYPNPTIAASWDSGWDTPPKTTIGDCEGIIFGGDLQSNAAATNTPPSSSSPAIEYHCVANDKDFLQEKGSRMYADRNYNYLVTECQQETNVVDCETGDHLQQRTNGGDDVVDEFLECIWVEKD